MIKENAWNVQEGKWYPLREKPSRSAAGGGNAEGIINAILIISSNNNNDDKDHKLSLKNDNAGVWLGYANRQWTMQVIFNQARYVTLMLKSVVQQ